MTVVPSDIRGNMSIICDTCGDVVRIPDVTTDSAVVWPLITGLGWTGSPFAAGSHRCPRCDADPPPVPVARSATAKTHSAAFDIRRRAGADTAVVTPLTDLDEASAGLLREPLADVVRTHRNVLLDMRAVAIIDSAGLGLLVRAHQDARDRGGSLALVAPSRYVLTVLHTMRLDQMFEILPTAE